MACSQYLNYWRLEMATEVSKIGLVQNATHFTICTLFLSINNLSSSSFSLLKEVFRFFPSGISGILPAVTSLSPQGFGPDGQNPRRHPRVPRVLGRKISLYKKKSRFFKNRARKVLPKSSQGIAEKFARDCLNLVGGRRITLRSLCTRFWSGKGRAVIK